MSGWYYVVSGPGADPVLTPCNCAITKTRRAAHLQKIDGLQASERGYSFGAMQITPANRAAVAAVVAASVEGAGMITLTGSPGVGKTYLLISAVNEARARGVPAIYTPLVDLLDYLRAAFAPDVELSFDRRWDLLVHCDVLAIDEIDEFNSTPWAMERFLRLVDLRWRAMGSTLTLFATNSPLESLPDKVESRLNDYRARVFVIGGVDRRKGGAK